MKTISKLTIAGILSLGLFITQSCVHDDDYATPPIECADKFVANITISELTTKVTTGALKLDANGAVADDLIMDAYVISSDETGNFYKTISLQDKVKDPTIGIQIEIDGTNLYTEYPLGARIQISLKGLVVAKDRGIMKIGSVDPAFAVGRIPSATMKKYIFKTCDAVQTIEPKVFNNLADALKSGNLNTLVTVNNIQFKQPEIDLTYGVNATTVNRSLIDKAGKEVDLRNSGFAKWYGDALPTGSGSITFVVSIYNSTWQVYIRDTKDVKFDQPRFDVGGGTNPGGGNTTEAANLLFKGSDFNNWSEFLASINSFGLIKTGYAMSGVGLGRDNTNALQLKGTPIANDYVFTTVVNNAIPATPKKITFYVKGTAGKSLSLNVYKTDGKYVVYNLGDLSNSAVTLASTDANQYNGIIDTKGEWVLVTLDITGVDIQKTAGQNVFALKVGKDVAYDLVVDNIKID